jgi:hypothetical protein
MPALVPRALHPGDGCCGATTRCVLTQWLGSDWAYDLVLDLIELS